MFVIYHNDLDGHAAGAVVAFTYEGIYRGDNVKPITYYCIDYKDDFPFNLIQQGEKVVIVDFSLQKPNEWEKLLDVTTDIIWIDHHETAIKKTGIQNKLKGLRSTKGSGASLAWKYYQNDEVPRAIQLVEDWDTWTHTFGNETLNFVAGMEIANTHPTSQGWKDLFNNNALSKEILDNAISNGLIINQYRNKNNAEYLKTFGFETSIDEYSVLAINRGRVSSLMFGDNINKYDIVSSFLFDGNLFTISLYSKKVHVGNLAQKYGGGGHPGAAGFQCKELPYKKKG